MYKPPILETNVFANLFHNPWLGGISLLVLVVLFSFWMEIRRVRDDEDEKAYQESLKEKGKMSKRYRLKRRAKRIMNKTTKQKKEDSR